MHDARSLSEKFTRRVEHVAHACIKPRASAYRDTVVLLEGFDRAVPLIHWHAARDAGVREAVPRKAVADPRHHVGVLRERHRFARSICLARLAQLVQQHLHAQPPRHHRRGAPSMHRVWVTQRSRQGEGVDDCSVCDSR